MQERQVSLKTGQVLQHTYTVLREVGQGGQASVWEVRDARGRLLALKSTTRGNPERLRRESELLKRLKHPCLPGWSDFFLLRSGEPCLVFELIQGVSLREVLSRELRGLTDHHKEQLLLQLALVLDFIHQRRVVHRDLQPENVLLTPDFWETPGRVGTVKLIDLGIAAEEDNERSLTVDGWQEEAPGPLPAPRRGPGSAPYMAPEMLEIAPEQRAQRADPRIDVFALGVLGYGLFVGKHPVGVPVGQGAGEDVFRNAYSVARTRASSWPAERPAGRLANVLLRCIQVERQERWRDGGEVLRELQEALGQTLTQEPAAEAPAVAEEKPRRSREATKED